MTLTVKCPCGAVELQLMGSPMIQYVCHCDDCQTVHGKAYACSVYPAANVLVKVGQTEIFTLKSSPRTRCRGCKTYLFAEVPGQPLRGVNADLLPATLFSPQFHLHCRYAAAPVVDDLPHFKDTPIHFKGSGEMMPW